MRKQSMIRMVGALLFSMCFAGTAQAQFNPTGHIQITGHHTNAAADLFESFGKIYQYTGGNPTWAVVHDPGAAPAGVGVVALPPNDKRCFFWLQAGIVKSRCETLPDANDWGSTTNWPGPGGQLVDSIAVLGVRSVSGAAAGQVPMVFAAHDSQVSFSRYVNGTWSPWILEQYGLVDWEGRDVDIHSIGADWEPGPNCGISGSNVASIAIAGGPGWQRFTVPADFSGQSVARPLFGNPVHPRRVVERIAPIPATGCGGASSFGNTLFVMNSGQLWMTQSPFTVIGPMPIPMPVRGHHVMGTANGFVVRVISTTGQAFDRAFTPTNPGSWNSLD